MSGIARKGDTDNFGWVITSGCMDDVKIDGQPVAVKGSVLNDGSSIVNGCIDTVKVNGVPVAVVGSTTTPHPIPFTPGWTVPGTINVGSDSSKAS